jgi:hypothetical protein
MNKSQDFAEQHRIGIMCDEMKYSYRPMMKSWKNDQVLMHHKAMNNNKYVKINAIVSRPYIKILENFLSMNNMSNG